MKRLPSLRRRSKIILAVILSVFFVTFVGIQIALSTLGDGAESEIDFALTTSNSNFTAGPTSNFPNVTTNATWEAWLLPTSDGTNVYKQFMNKEQSFVFARYNGEYQWAFGNGTSWSSPAWYSTGATAPLNEWQHVAFVKAGPNLKFFLNGQLVYENTNLTFSALGTNASYPLTIGGRFNSSDAFAGQIDEVKIWNVARTQAEITTGMHSRVAVNATGLLGYWDFNEPSGSTVYNRSAAVAGTNLTFSGSPVRDDVKKISTISGGDTVVKFPRTYLPGVGGWTVPAGITKVKAVVVAGGGGGGAWVGGGGGAGGFKDESAVSVSAGSIAVQVGQGGKAAMWTSSLNFDINGVRQVGSQGQSSAFGTSVVTSGGGWGGSHNGQTTTLISLTQAAPSTGGSGGGGTGNNGNCCTNLQAARIGAAGTVGQGNSGGDGSSVSGLWVAAGGGGAGAVGTGGASLSSGGAGGAGLASSITGTSTYYAGGGGGSYWTGTPHGAGGSGGGGGGGINGTAGTANTGGGGGGGAHNVSSAGGAGGSGVVIIRYSPTLDKAWVKAGTGGYYASATSEIIPVATNAEWTVEAWVNPDSLTTGVWYGILGQANAGASRYSIWSYGQASLHVTTPDTSVAIPYKLETNRWTHIAWAMTTGTTSTLYIDGQQVWQGTMTRSANAGPLFTVGGAEQATDNELSGSIDQVKVWGSALTAAQVQTSMHSYNTFTGSPTLRAHYDFNETENGVLFDRSGNARNLALPSTFGNSELSSTPIVENGPAHSHQTYYKFKRSYLTANGGWTAPNQSKAKALVIAGGGGGGGGPSASNAYDHMNGGGGGAGGLKFETSLSITAGGTYPIKIGAGGLGTIQGALNANTASASTKGQSSAFGSLLSTSGGGAGGYMSTTGTIIAATTGGSGGGGGAQAGAAYPITGAAGTSGEGNSGGNGFDWNGSFQGAGGGGGAGGIGAAANNTTRTSGAGGPGLAFSITGSSVTYAGGGGGGTRSDTAGAGGAGGGGAGGRASSGSLAAANLGGGGGGGSSNGGNGGSGVVILSFGPVLEVSRTSTSNRPGSSFNQPIQVTLREQDGTTAFAASQASVTVSAPAGVLQLNGTSITSTSVTTVNGVATFSGLGFQSGVTSAQTLTFTSDAFVGVTQSITPSFLASSITINSGVTTGGAFSNGVFEANSNGAVNILNSDLVTALAAGAVTIETSGSITISAAVQSATENGLTLKAGTDISQGAVAVSTANGAITYWADYDVGATRGGIQTARGSSITTNGGSLTLSGGADITTGYAKGTANSSHRGVNLQGAISTGAGNIIIRGEDAATESGTSGNWGAGVLVNDDSSITTTSGTVTITGLTNTDNTGASHYHSGVMIGFSFFGGTNQPTYADAFITTDAGNISINGTAATVSSAHRYGVLFYKSSVTSTSGSIAVDARTTRADAIDISFGSASTGNTISTGGAVTITGDTSGATSAFSGSTISAGGALTLNVNKPTFTSMTFNGAGSKTIQHPTTATNFGAAVDITGVTFASTTASLTVGRSGVTPNQNVTLGNASTSIAGNITVYGAGITQSGAVVTTSGGNVTYSGAGAYSQTAALTSAGSITQSGGTTVSVTGATQAAGAISYTGSGAVSNSSAGTITSTGSTVTLASTGSTMALAGNVVAKTSLTISQTAGYSGAGTLTAQGGTLSVSGGTTVAFSGALSATGNITISGSTEITNPIGGTIDSGAAISITSSTTSINLSKAVTAATNLTLQANTSITTSAAIKATTGSVSITSATTSISLGAAVDAGTSIAVTPKTTYAGAGVLTAGTTLTISGGTTVDPTGNLNSVGNMALSGSGRLTLNGITAAVSGTGTMTLTGGTLASTNGGLELIGSNLTTTSGGLTITGNASASWGFYIRSTSKIQTTSGAITIIGNSNSGVWGGHFAAADVLSTSGAIVVDTKNSYGISPGYTTTTNFGAISPATSSSDIQILGNVYGEVTYQTAVTYRTSGNVIIESTGANFLIAPTMRAHTFDGNGSVRIGKTGNNTAVTINGSATVTGDYTVNGAAITQNAPVTTDSGNITLDAGGTVSTTGALTAGGGLYITGATSLSSTAAWITNSALDVSASGTISTSSVAPITVNTGLLSLVSSGGTLTIGDDVTVPGNITLTGTTATISQPVSSSAGSVSITGSTGAISVTAAVTASTSLTISPATTYSGAGALTAGSTLTISGGSTVNPSGDVTAGGNLLLSGSGRIDFDNIDVGSTAGTVTITAGTSGSTAGHIDVVGGTITSNTGAINITANATSAYGFYFSSGAVVRTTSGSINITGNTSSNVWGGYFENSDIVSTSGAITVIGGGLGVVTGHNGATEFGSTAATSSESAITIRGNRYWASNTAVTYKTTGAVVIESVADLFAEDTTVQNATFTDNSSLRIGKETNTRSMTVSGTVSIAGNYQVYGAGITQNAPVTTSGSGNITFTGAGAFSNSGALNAGGGIYITGATTLTATGAWTANAALDVQASGNISTNNVSSITVNTGLVKLNSTAGTVTIGATLQAPGPITLLGGTVTANANVIATLAGQNILMKSRGTISLADNVTIQTAGGSAATIVFWTSSGGTAGGYMDINNRVCINTQGSCTSPLETGGADIYFGGGLAGTTYPTGPVTGGANSSVQIGVNSFGAKKIYSAGGKISMKGQSVGGGHGMIVSSGTDVDSGVGAIEISGQTNATDGWGIYFCQSHTTGACNFTSSKTSGTAISVTGTAAGGTSSGWAPGLGSYSGGSVSSTFKADGGGDLQISGTSTYHNDMIISSLNFYTSTGDIYLNAANKGVLFAYQGNLKFGGAISADSTGDVFITTDIYYDDTANTNTFNTTGTVSIVPFNNSFDSGSGYNKIDTSTIFNGVTGLTFGKSSNTTAVEFAMLPNIAGPINITAGNTTITNGLTSTGASSSVTIAAAGTALVNGAIQAAGPMKITSTGTATLNKNLTSTSASSGILVKSQGTIATGAGTNTTTGATAFTTTGGPITLWAGSDGSGTITIAKYNLIDSNSSGTTGGGDITIGGGTTAAAGNADKPAGPVVTASGDAVKLGSDATTDSVQINGDGGKVYIGGDTTSTSSADSGVEYWPGLKINAGEVEIYGRSATGAATNNTAAGLFSAQTASATTVPVSIVATDAYLAQTQAIKITGASSSNYGAMLGNYAPMTIQTTGAYGAIAIYGSTTDTNASGVWIGKTTIKSTSGYISIDSSNDQAEIGKDSARPATIGDSSTTGNITINSAAPVFVSSTFATTGQIFIEPESGQSSFASSVGFPTGNTTLSGNETGLFVGGENGNTSTVSISAALSIAGPIYYWAGNLLVSASINSSGGDQRIGLTANQMTIGATVDAGTTTGTGYIDIEPLTVSKTTALGSADSSTQLGLTDAELDYLGANTLRIGDLFDATSGDITVTGAISIATSKVAKTAIRTTGAVSGTGTITATNLGIKAASINLGGTFAISGNLALAAAAAPTFSSSTTYTPAAVDGIAADFGTPFEFALSQVPVNTPTDAFMAVAFTPPPVATLQDKFHTTLQTNNSYSTTNITASKASGSGTLAGTLTRAATAGSATFTGLQINTATGNHTLRFSALSGAVTATTGTYNIQAGDPDHLIVKRSAAGGRAGIAFTTQPQVEIQTASNTVVTTNGTTLNVTASLSSGTGGLVGTKTVQAVNGVATFTDLAIEGSADNTYGITFTATYNTNPAMTVAQNSISITFGIAAKLVLTTAASGFENRANFTTQPIVTVQDAWDNTVTDWSTNVVASISGAQTSGLTGTTSIAVSSGVATFTNLGKTGKAELKTLAFSSGLLAQASQQFTLTHGAAAGIGVTTSAAGATVGVNLTTQPAVTIQDADGNPVNTGTQSTQNVVLTTSAGTTLSGTTTVGAVNGVATYAGLQLNGTAGSTTFTYTISSPSTITGTQAITLVAGTPTQLIVVTGAASCSSRIACTTQPVVKIADASGNATTSTATVTATITSGTGTISAGNTMAAVGGVATFSGFTLQGTAGTFTIQFATSSPSVSVSQTGLTLSAGTPTKLLIETAAAGAVNRSAFTTQPAVFIADADGNKVASATGSIAVAVSTGALGKTSTLSGTSPVASSSGKSTFSGLTLTGGADTYTLTYSLSPYTSVGQNIALTPGAATKLVIKTAASGFVNRTNFTTQPQIEIQDADNNLVDDSSTVITASITGGTIALSGTVTATAVNGVATFSGLGKNGLIATSKVLAFATNGLTGISQTFTLTHGAATQIVVTRASGSSGNVTNDQAFSTQPQVTIKDQDGNTVSTGSDSNQNVVASMTSGLSGTTSVPAVNGVATFTDLKYTGLIGSKTITYTIASPSTISTSESLTVTYGTASQLAITTNASDSASGTTFTTQPIVEVRDVSGNKVANSTLRITASVGIGTLASSGNVYADAVSGVATFAGLKLTGAIGSYTLSFSGASVSSASQSIVISHGAPSYLTVTSSSSATVGVDLAQQPEVSIYDASGNLVTTGVGATTTVTLSAAGMTSKTATASAGVARFTGVQLSTAAGNVTVTSSISSPNSASGTKVVALTAGTPTQLIVTTSAASCSARIACTTQPVVKIADAAGNATTSTATVTAAVTSGTGSVSAGSTIDAVGGIATFSGLTLSGTAGTFTIQYSIASPSLNVNQTGLTLSAGTATQLLVQTPATGAVNAIAFTTQPVVIIADADNNKVTSASGTITASIGTGIATKTAIFGSTTTASASSGQATFTGLTLTGGADSYTITYTHATYGTATQSITVGVGAATQLAITTAANGAVIGANFATQPVIEVRDSGGNRVTTSNASVAVAATGATLAGTSPVSAINGVVTFAGLKLTGSAGTKTLTFTSNGLAQTAQNIELVLGTPTKLIISTSATGAVNRANFGTQPVIEIQDDYGNVVTTATDAVTVTMSGASLTDGGTAALSKTVNAVNGVATFSGLGAYGLVGSKTLAFSSGSLTGASQSIALTHGVATNLVMSADSTLANATVFTTQPIVTIRDQDNNTVTTGSTSTQLVTLSSSDATVGGTASMNAVAGVANFTGKNVKLTAIVGVRHIVATVTSPAIIVASNSVTITPGVATQLAIKTAASGFVNRAAFTTQPEIEIQDVSGNVVDTSTASVAASISGGTIALGGTISVNAVNGVATFTNLSKYGTVSGAKTLSFASNLLTGTSQTFTLINGTPTQLAIITKPTTARAGQTIGDSVIELRDQDGNPVISGTGATAPVAVVAVKATESVARSLTGSSTVNAIAGRATFSDLVLNEEVGTYNFAFGVPSPSVFASATGVNFDFELTAGSAVDMRVTQNVSNVARNANMSPAVKVQLIDANGNDVLDDSATQVSFSVVSSSGDTVVSESVARTAVNGEVTFSAVNQSLAPTNGLNLKFKISGTSYIEESGSFNLLPGAVAEVRITQQPSTLNAQSERTMTGELLKIQPIVSLYDNGGYLVDNLSSGSVTLAISTGSGGTLNGTASASISAGIATFSGVKLVGRPAGTGGALAENYKLQFSYGSVVSAQSNSMSVTHNVADHLTATRSPGVGQAGVPLGGTDRPQIEIRDRYDNLVNTGTQATELIHVDAAIASGSGAASLVGSTTISANAGVATFNIGVGGLVSNTYSLNYSFINDSSVTSATQTGIQVTAGDVAKLVFTRQPATVANSVQNKTGESLKVQPILEFQDNYDNLVPVSYQVNAVIQGSPDVTKNYLINPNKSAVNGVVTYTSLGLVSAPGVSREITFYWNGVPTTNRTSSASLSVTHADAHHLTIVTQPAATSSVRTGDALSTQPKIEVRDNYENVVTSMTSGQFITAAVTTGGGSSDTTDGVVRNINTAEILNGVAQFSGLKIVATPGTAQKLTFTGATFTSAESDAFTVTYAAAAKLAISQQPCSGAVSGGVCANGPTGSALVTQPVVAVQDRFGNLVANSTGAVTVSLTGTGGTLTNAVDTSGTAFTVNAVNGYATFANLVLTATPLTNYQLNFASAGLTGIASGNIQVTHGAPTQLIMVSQPQGSATGSELSVQPVLRVADAYGNTATTDNSTVVTATTSSGVVRATISSGVNRTASNGIVTFDDLTFNGTPQVNYSLNFSSGSLTGVTSANFTVTHAGLNKLVWRTQPVGAQTGENLATQPVLELQDFENNITTSDSATVVRVTVSGSGGSVTGSTTATAVNGIVTFAGLKLVGTPGVDYTLRVSTDSGPTIQSPVSQYVRVTHARPAQLSIQLPVIASHFISGTAPAEQPKLFVLDSYGNKATTDNSTVVTAFIATGVSGTVTGRTTATAVNGEVQFSGLQIAGTPGTAYTLGFSAVTSDSRTFNVNDNLANAFTMDKVADLTINYVDQAYVPSGQSGNVVSVTRTTDSPGTITYSTSSASTICTVNSSTGAITIAGVGNCVIAASIAATADYRANTTTDTFVISKAAQSAPNITSDDNVDFWQYLTPGAIGGASATTGFVWSVDGDCQLVGGKVWPGNAGSVCDLFVFKRGNANYLNSPVTEMRITINKIGQQPLAIGNSNSVNVGDVELFTTGGSGDGSAGYTVSSSNNTAGCAIQTGSGGANVLHATANGSCRVAATKAASTNFLVALSPTKTFTFSKQDQSVTFTSTIPMAPVPLTSYTPSATASSGLVATIAISAGSGTVCEWDATVTTKINFLSTGVCDVTATQSGNASFNSATATQRITVGSLNQTITFEQIANKTYGNPNFRLAATSNSGLAVTYRLGSNVSPQACSVSTAGLVTLTSAGFCEIVAEQAGNNIYLAAPPVTRMFQVAADFAGKPRVVSVSAGNQWFTATFTQPSYLGGATVSDYILEVTNRNGDVYENAACGTAAVNGEITCTVVGIPIGIAYNARVAAITEAGVGLMSDSAGPLTPARQTQGVTNLAAVSSGSSLVVSYDAPLVTDSVVTGYQIYVAPVGGTFGSTPITTQNLTATIPVSSISSASVSSASTNSASARTATMRAASMRIASVPSSSPSASSSTASSGYQVKVVTITQSAEALDPNDYVTSGLHIGTTVPSAPRAITTALVAGSVSKSVFISWSTPISDGGVGISGYDVIVDGVTVCSATSSLTCELTNATDGKNYQVSVVAKYLNSQGVLASGGTVTTVHAMPALPVSSGGGAAPTPTIAPTPAPTQTTRPTPRPTQTTRPTTPPAPTQAPTVAPTSAPTAAPTAAPTSAPTAAPTSEPSAGPEPLSPTVTIPEINPGEPVANPAIGATGDDSAPPAPFDPTGSPEAISAAVETTTNVVALAGALAATAAAAGAAAAAAAAGAAAGSVAAGGLGGSTPGGSTGGAASSADAGRKPEDISGGEDGSESDEPDEGLDVVQDNLTLERENWGDRLAMFTLPFITFFDRRSHNAAERIANYSPFFAKLINDGAYLRAMLGTISFIGPLVAATFAIIAVNENAAEIAAGQYSQIITPGWIWFLAIAVLGAFDASAGFVGAMVYIIGSIISVGHIPDTGEVRTMMGIILVSVAPALLTTGFRTIRKHAALDFNSWWERIADFIIAPFMAGWSVSAMVSGLPALAGLTLDTANHVSDFVVFIAVAVFARVALEEFAARAFPARLNKINPDEIPDPSNIQKAIVLVIKYFLWVFIGGALIGPSWQVWVGSALFVFPAVVGWYTDKFPNSPRIWRLLPTGIPGLAFTLLVASATSATVGAVLGQNPALGQWSFVILPIPMLAITVLGWFGRHGAVDANGVEEVRPGKRNKWLYRIGGVIVMFLTLKLAGVI